MRCPRFKYDFLPFVNLSHPLFECALVHFQPPLHHGRTATREPHYIALSECHSTRQVNAVKLATWTSLLVNSASNVQTATSLSWHICLLVFYLFWLTGEKLRRTCQCWPTPRSDPLQGQANTKPAQLGKLLTGPLWLPTPFYFFFPTVMEAGPNNVQRRIFLLGWTRPQTSTGPPKVQRRMMCFL